MFVFSSFIIIIIIILQHPYNLFLYPSLASSAPLREKRRNQQRNNIPPHDVHLVVSNNFSILWRFLFRLFLFHWIQFLHRRTLRQLASNSILFSVQYSVHCAVCTVIKLLITFSHSRLNFIERKVLFSIYAVVYQIKYTTKKLSQNKKTSRIAEQTRIIIGFGWWGMRNIKVEYGIVYVWCMYIVEWCNFWRQTQCEQRLLRVCLCGYFFASIDDNPSYKLSVHNDFSMQINGSWIQNSLEKSNHYYVISFRQGQSAKLRFANLMLFSLDLIAIVFCFAKVNVLHGKVAIDISLQ